MVNQNVQNCRYTSHQLVNRRIDVWTIKMLSDHRNSRDSQYINMLSEPAILMLISSLTNGFPFIQSARPTWENPGFNVYQ